MKLYAPKYYQGFRCKADKCKHSCCVGWEIDIDPASLKKYESFSSGYGLEIQKSIDYTEYPHFKLGERERCPHLDKNGLCKIILNCGEENLCHICHEHPRFYNHTSKGVEVGLGMACEEAARIILSEDFCGETVEIGEINRDVDDIEYVPVEHLEKIYGILSDGSLAYNDKLVNIGESFGVYPSFVPDERWGSVISSLEYLDDAHKEHFLSYSSYATVSKEKEKYLLRGLAYFVYRHCSSVSCYEEFLASLGFCLFCERLFATLLSKELGNSFQDAVEAARIISEEIEYSVDNTEEIKNIFYFAI